MFVFLQNIDHCTRVYYGVRSASCPPLKESFGRHATPCECRVVSKVALYATTHIRSVVFGCMKAIYYFVFYYNEIIRDTVCACSESVKLLLSASWLRAKMHISSVRTNLCQCIYVKRGEEVIYSQESPKMEGSFTKTLTGI